MWRFFWSGFAVVLVLVALGLWVSTQATFLYRHPTAKDARIVIDYRTGSAVVMQPVSLEAGLPRVEVEQPEFDFGTMNPLTMGRHDFVIRNAGDAPLKLRVGPTTCKCTLSGLDKSELTPGEETRVHVEWNSGRDERYEHSATIYTSDPDRRRVELRIRGRVISQLAADVGEIVVPPLKPDTQTVTDVLLYSQVWDQFDITAVDCSLAGVAGDVLPLDREAAPELRATAVQCLRLSIPDNLPSGPFTGVVRVSANSASGEEHRLELPLFGTVLPRLDLLGGEVDPYGNIDLGSIRAGTSKRVRLLVKVYDRDPQLDQASVTVFPEFMVASLRPHSGTTARGLYALEIEVPENAPVGQYRGHPRAEVRIASGHPRIGDVKLGVTFVVVPRSRR